MMQPTQAIVLIAACAVCTFLTRLVPFALFGGKKEPPKFVRYLGRMLPPAVIVILIVYCLKSWNFSVVSTFVPQVICVMVVAILHVWKRNNLLSIGVGTLLYMFLIQVVF